MTAGPAGPGGAPACLVHCLTLLSLNAGALSFGLALGWVSLWSAEGAEDGAGVVLAAAATFVSGALCVPLAARALHLPRRPLLAGTSAAFAGSWALTWCGGRWAGAARALAGLAGAFAWTLAPILASEMLEGVWAGAGAAAPVLAHNLGMLLMYLADYLRLPHRQVLAGCLAVSALHAAAALLGPDSPPHLAADGRHQEAVVWLSRLRGVARDHPSLAAAVRALPAPHRPPLPLWKHAKDLVSDGRRRRAFLIVLVAVVGQEAGGMLTLLQFAGRVFALAGAGGGEGGALLLGGVQLAAAGLALPALAVLPRKRLLVWCASGTAASLAVAAAAVAAGAGAAGAGWSGPVGAVALAAATAGDSLGLQPVPYALLYHMFHHQWVGCAALMVMCAGSAANALETLVFPGVVRAAGLPAALALAAAITLLYTGFVAACVPETRGRTVDQIYAEIYPDNTTHDKEAAPQVGASEHYTITNDLGAETIVTSRHAELKDETIHASVSNQRVNTSADDTLVTGVDDTCKIELENVSCVSDTSTLQVDVPNDDNLLNSVNRNDEPENNIEKSDIRNVNTADVFSQDETGCISTENRRIRKYTVNDNGDTHLNGIHIGVGDLNNCVNSAERSNVVRPVQYDDEETPPETTDL